MSQTKPIPFSASQASALSEFSGAMPLQLNFLPDPADALRVRPGLGVWDDFPTAAPNASPVISMFVWRQYLLYVCEDRTIWAWLGPGSVVALSDATAATQLDGTGKPVWTYDNTRVALTGGGAPQQWQGIGLSSRLAPGAVMPDGSPLALTHIAYLAQRFVGTDNNNTGVWQWTDPGSGNHGTWPVVGAFYAEAESSPDPLVALYSNTNEAFLFGTQTLQVFVPDPVSAFAAAASVQVGCIVPFGIIDTDQSFAWLDDRRRIVQSSGRNFQVLSTPAMTADLATLETVSDCWGARFRIGTWDLLFWAFPTEKRAFWYDRNTKKWGEWNSITSTGDDQAWIGRSYVYWPDKNIHLVGLDNGTIATMSTSERRDIDLPIRAVSRTGFQDRGTFVRKCSERVQMQVRRLASTAGTPVFEYRYRNGVGPFSVARRGQLASTSYESVVEMGVALGDYRARQHELSFTDAAEFVMTGAVETFNVGDY